LSQRLQYFDIKYEYVFIITIVEYISNGLFDSYIAIVNFDIENLLH